jgi:hypothetical protein
MRIAYSMSLATDFQTKNDTSNVSFPSSYKCQTLLSDPFRWKPNPILCDTGTVCSRKRVDLF